MLKNLTDKQREFRREVSRLSAMANKRIKRLQESNLKSSPALEKWEREGAEFFGIRGKSQQEVRNEYYRVKNYLDSSTSSITGAKKTLVTLAENTGIKYDHVDELTDKATVFFELANKVDEYLSVTNRGVEAIGYQRIWEAINTYVQDSNIKLENMNVNSAVDIVAELSEDMLLKHNRHTYDSFFNTNWTEL